MSKPRAIKEVANTFVKKIHDRKCKIFIVIFESDGTVTCGSNLSGEDIMRFVSPKVWDVALKRHADTDRTAEGVAWKKLDDPAPELEET